MKESNFAQAEGVTCNLLTPKENRILSITNFGIRAEFYSFFGEGSSQPSGQTVRV